ncbi:ion transporter [bacterium]|nr:MAG: ion transporter [bacterium]
MAEANLKNKLYTIIFEAETKAGKLFDVLLAFAILASLMVVFLDSVRSIREVYGEILLILEYVFTVLFTIEYVIRLMVVQKPLRYARSFYGIIDIVAILPTYLMVFIPGVQTFLSIRVIRLLRIFRILKLVSYIDAAKTIGIALTESRKKISVFIFAVLITSTLFGSAMYIVEGEENGFTDIPTSIYWTIVTMTTVGYGDISPVTPLGKLIAVVLMIMGFGIIAVPTGIVTAEMALQSQKKPQKSFTETCPNCLYEEHDKDAVYCKKCGSRLNEA